MKKSTVFKRIFVLLTAAFVLVFAACGAPANQPSDNSKDTPQANNETPADNNPGGSGESEDVIELELWLAGTEEDNHYKAIPHAVKAFEDANPGIKVNVVLGGPVEEYAKKISLMAETDSLPDFFLDGMSGVEGFLNGGVLLDITDYMKNDEEWSSYQYVEGAFNNMERVQNGRRSGIPMNATIQGWFFNKDLFDAQNLEIPNTWDELINAIKVFKEAGITPIAHGPVDTWSIWGYYAMFSQYGIDQIGQDIANGATTWKESMVEPFNRIKDMADAGAFADGVASMTHAQARSAFLNGEAPIFTVGSWESEALSNEFKGTLDFRFSFLDMPNTSYEQNVGVKGIDWLIFAGSSLKESDAKLEAGLKFLKYMSSPEASEILLKNGYAFPAWSCGDINSIDGISDVTKTMFASLTNDTQPAIESYSYVDGRLYTAFWNAVSSVISGSITPEEAAQQLDDNLELLQ